MAYVVLAAWLVQSTIGVTLLMGWIRHGRGRSAASVLAHVGLALTGLAFWSAFVVTGSLAPAWLAFVVITVANGFGDAMLVRRYRRSAGATTFWRDYGRAIGEVLHGRTPVAVTFHAVFAGVVYFSCLGVCIGASVATAG